MKKILAVCVLMVAFAMPSVASAKGFGFISHGDELVEVGPIPEAPGRVVGSLCQHVSVLWANIYTWNCRLVVTDKELQKYMEIPEPLQQEFEARYSVANAQRDVWAKYGIFVLIGLFGLMALKKKKPSEATAT